MKEVVGAFMNQPVGPTFFRGSKPIDGVWATSDISVCNAAIMSASYGIGDHPLFVIDFTESDVIEISQQKVIRPTSRRLNTKIPRVTADYTRILEEKVLFHRLIEQMGTAHQKSVSKESAIKRLNKLDKELGQYMRYVKKKCHKIKSGHIPFLPKASLWIRWTQVYQSLLNYHAGRIKNRGNLKQAAQQCHLSIEEIFLRLKVCVDQCDHFRKNGKYYRRKHLYRRLEIAKEKENEEAERQILLIIQQEKDKSFWRRLNYALGKPRGGACFKVQLEQEEGTVEEISSKEDLHEAIWENIHRKHFNLDEDASMCSGQLRGIFGYNSVSPTANSLLEGKYAYPPDFDDATKEILQECALICICVPKNSVTTTITPEDWTNHWRRARA